MRLHERTKPRQQSYQSGTMGIIEHKFYFVKGSNSSPQRITKVHNPWQGAARRLMDKWLEAFRKGSRESPPRDESQEFLHAGTDMVSFWRSICLRKYAIPGLMG
jgi:hypothetical protein